MRWSKIHRIEILRSLFAPGHTASKTQGLYCNLQSDVLYGLLNSACGLLNAASLKSMADFVIPHKIDCAFFLRHLSIRCRGPPPTLDEQKFRE